MCIVGQNIVQINITQNSKQTIPINDILPTILSPRHIPFNLKHSADRGERSPLSNNLDWLKLYILKAINT